MAYPLPLRSAAYISLNKLKGCPRFHSTLLDGCSNCFLRAARSVIHDGSDKNRRSQAREVSRTLRRRPPEDHRSKGFDEGRSNQKISFVLLGRPTVTVCGMQTTDTHHPCQIEFTSRWSHSQIFGLAFQSRAAQNESRIISRPVILSESILLQR
jgi:hypothetical protein